MSKFKILVVEDESIIALNLKENLIELGFEPCGITPNRCRTIDLLEKGCKPDLILMDIYLSGPTNGIEFAKELKQTLPNVPVIFLTANSELATIKEASQTYAYGYILKPYKKNILKANIDIALNKSKEDFMQSSKLETVTNINKILKDKIDSKEITKTNMIELKFQYLYDKKKKKLYHQGKIIELTSKETDIINLLCENAGYSISNDQIEQVIWQDKPAGYAALRSILYRLRNKIHKDLIVNKNNMGYKIEKAKNNGQSI